MEEQSALATHPSTSSSVTASEINEAHEIVVRCAARLMSTGNEFVIKAAECGKLLLSKKDELGHGNWLPWLAGNCPNISHDTARDYMKLGSNYERVRNLEGATSLRKAIAMLDDKQQGGSEEQEKPLFSFRFVLNTEVERLDAVQRRTMFDQARPALELFESFGFIELKL